MHKDTFNNLMGQFSTEAETVNQQELLAAKRRDNIEKLRKYCFRALIIAVIGAGFYFRHPICTKLDSVTAQMLHKKPTLTPQQEARIGEIREASVKRDKILDEAMK
jgi:hypothetical protein